MKLYEDRMIAAVDSLPHKLPFRSKGTIFQDIQNNVLTTARSFDSLSNKKTLTPKDYQIVERDVAAFETYCKLIKKHRKLQLSEFASTDTRDLSDQFYVYVEKLRVKNQSKLSRLVSFFRNH